MAEEQVVIDVAGREWQGGDVNRVGMSSGLADDRVLAELFRLTPYDGSTVAKGVLPYAVGSSMASGLIKPRTGGVDIYPLRAIVGTRTAVATDSKKWWQDIRSALLLANAADHVSVAIANGDVSNPRWDLIYVTVAVDSTFGETRYKKDPTTKIISAATINTYKKSTATINVLAGTPGASPALPALPADSGSNYNIPLGYVRVPTGFTGATTLTRNDVREIAPVLGLQSGAISAAPASSLYKPGGSLNTRIPWAASGNRPPPFLASCMEGGVSRFFQLQLAAAATKSAVSTDVLDDSVDWRGRFFLWFASGHATLKLATDPSNTVAVDSVPNEACATTWGMSNYMYQGAGFAAKVPSGSCGLSGDVALVVSNADGSLSLSTSGTPNANLFIWLFGSAPYANR